MRTLNRLGPVVVLAALAALLQPVEPPPVFAAHTPAQTGKQWTAGTAALGPQLWTHTNYWTCNAASCDHRDITPKNADRGAAGVSSCSNLAATGGPGCGHKAGVSGWSYNTGSHTDTAQQRHWNCTLASGSATTFPVASDGTGSEHCGEWVDAEPAPDPEPEPPTVTPPPTTEPPASLLVSCPAGWHRHDDGTGHGGACRQAHTQPACSTAGDGSWTAGHALGTPGGHRRVTGLPACPQSRNVFCADSGLNVWYVTLDRQSGPAGYPESSPPRPLRAGYDRNRIPAGAGLQHSQFTPSATIGGVRDPARVTLAPGVWAAAAAVNPQARFTGSAAAVDYDWNDDFTGGRFRSCGRITWGAPAITWQTDNPLLVLDSDNGRIRWNAAECPAAGAARLTVNAAWRIRLNHTVNAYDGYYSTVRQKTWTIGCGTARIQGVCQRSDLASAALRAASGTAPRLYHAQHRQANNRWKGSTPAYVYKPPPGGRRPSNVASWNYAPAVLRPPSEIASGTRAGEPPLVLLDAPVTVGHPGSPVGRYFSSGDGPTYRLRTGGVLGTRVRVPRSDGSTADCGTAAFELRSLTWSLAADEFARATGRMLPLDYFAHSGLRRARTGDGDGADLPRTCRSSGWSGDPQGTNLGYEDCAGEAFFEIDLECGPGAVLTLPAWWLVTVPPPPLGPGRPAPAVTGERGAAKSIRFEPPGDVKGCTRPGS